MRIECITPGTKEESIIVKPGDVAVLFRGPGLLNSGLAVSEVSDDNRLILLAVPVDLEDSARTKEVLNLRCLISERPPGVFLDGGEPAIDVPSRKKGNPHSTRVDHLTRTAGQSLISPTDNEAQGVLAKLNHVLDVDPGKVSADEKNRLPEYKIGMKGLALLSKIDFNQLPGKKAFIEKLQRPENATYSPVNEVGKNPTIREELNTDNTFQEGLTLEEWAEQNPKHFLTRGMQA